MDSEHQSSNFCIDLFGTLRLLFSKDMLFVNMNLIWGGTTIAYWAGLLTPIMTLQNPDLDEDHQISKALYGMVAFGVGEVFGGFLHGLLIDRIGSKKAVLVNICILIIVIAATELSLNSLEYNYLTFIMCFCWGYEDGSQNIFLFQLLGFEIDKSMQEEAFGCFNVMQGLSVFSFQMIQGQLIDSKNQDQLIYYTYAIGGFGLICQGLTYFFDF